MPRAESFADPRNDQILFCGRIYCPRGSSANFGKRLIFGTTDIAGIHSIGLFRDQIEYIDGSFGGRIFIRAFGGLLLLFSSCT